MRQYISILKVYLFRNNAFLKNQDLFVFQVYLLQNILRIMKECGQWMLQAK